MSLFNRFLFQPAAQRLANLPLPCSVQLPGGQRIGAAQSRLHFTLRGGRALRHLVQGAIGHLAEDYVEGRLEIEGRLRDLILAAPTRLGTDPTHESTSMLPRLFGRLQRNSWERSHHSRAKDTAQVQNHYDISDDFYAI